jgi:multiple sugar transport system permease protein
MTNGAPGRETQTAIFWIAETGLQNFQMGEAAAASWILTLFLMLLSLVVYGGFRARGAMEAS